MIETAIQPDAYKLALLEAQEREEQRVQALLDQRLAERSKKLVKSVPAKQEPVLQFEI